MFLDKALCTSPSPECTQGDVDIEDTLFRQLAFGAFSNAFKGDSLFTQVSKKVANTIYSDIGNRWITNIFAKVAEAILVILNNTN